MGGFAFSDESLLPPGITRGTFTPDGFQLFLEHGGELPNITKEDIDDKSKSSTLGKLFACTQLLWFCLQCIARKNQGLSLSLLEITTLAHIVFAIFIYAFWWDKPFNVDEPTLVSLKGRELQPLLAYMWMSSALSARSGNKKGVPEFECIKFVQESTSQSNNEGDIGADITTSRNESPDGRDRGNEGIQTENQENADVDLNGDIEMTPLALRPSREQASTALATTPALGAIEPTTAENIPLYNSNGSQSLIHPALMH
jgi:hypothetical protein